MKRLPVNSSMRMGSAATLCNARCAIMASMSSTANARCLSPAASGLDTRGGGEGKENSSMT